MPLPDFFLIGSAKAGTSALCHALAQHPDVYLPPVKEPFFFAFERGHVGFAGPHQWSTRYREPHDYLTLFSGAGAHRVIGEASTIYIASPTAARRIRDNVPSAKLVAVLRHPVERAYSHYWFAVRAGIETARTFEDALAEEDAGLRAGWSPWMSYRALGLYHAQLSEYHRLFASAQIKVYLYEDWRASPRELLRDLFGFLGVDPVVETTVREVNVGRAQKIRRLHRLAARADRPWLRRLDRRYNSMSIPPMRSQTRLRLLAFYREDIAGLQALMDRELSPWIEDRPERIHTSGRTAFASS